MARRGAGSGDGLGSMPAGGLREQGVTEMFQVVWVAECEAGAARPVDLGEGGEGRRRWAELIRELIHGRFEAEATRILRPPEGAFGVADGDLRLLWRLAGAFTLVGGSIDPPGRFERVLGAIRLQRWCLARAGVEQATWAARPVEPDDCDRMLQKISDMAPVSARDLFRRYDRQVAAQHRPVLDELLSRGLVRLDHEGNLVITGFPEARPLTALTVGNHSGR